MKDKAFFFVDYEGQRESGAQAGLSCVPDPNAIAQAKAIAAARRSSAQPADSQSAGAQSLAAAQHSGPSANVDGTCNPPAPERRGR